MLEVGVYKELLFRNQQIDAVPNYMMLVRIYPNRHMPSSFATVG